MKELYSYFNRLYSENKLSHAFLIGNVFYDDIEEELAMIINDFFVKSNMNINENPDVFILRNNEGIVSKDDIKELLVNLNKTSQFHNAKVYVIENSEKLNDFSCNALLKTLEEPPANVYAILLSSNMDDVKDTIYSRCQKIFVSSSASVKENTEELDEITDKIIDYIEKLEIKTISKKYDIYSIIEDRKMFVDILQNMLLKYKKSLDGLIKNVESDIINKNNNIEEISRKILVIDESISRLEIPLNKNLSIDRFIIEMWRCKNENS